MHGRWFEVPSTGSLNKTPENENFSPDQQAALEIIEQHFPPEGEANGETVQLSVAEAKKFGPIKYVAVWLLKAWKKGGWVKNYSAWQVWQELWEWLLWPCCEDETSRKTFIDAIKAEVAQLKTPLSEDELAQFFFDLWYEEDEHGNELTYSDGD